MCLYEQHGDVVYEYFHYKHQFEDCVRLFSSHVCWPVNLGHTSHNEIMSRGIRLLTHFSIAQHSSRTDFKMQSHAWIQDAVRPEISSTKMKNDFSYTRLKAKTCWSYLERPLVAPHHICTWWYWVATEINEPQWNWRIIVKSHVKIDDMNMISHQYKSALCIYGENIISLSHIRNTWETC